MDLQEIIYTLTNAERQVLLAFKKLGRETLSYEEIKDVTNLSESEISRAALWLENKGIAKRIGTSKTIYVLSKKGIRYLSKSLPERIILNALETYGSLPMEKLRELGLTKEEIGGAIGYLSKLGLIKIAKKGGSRILTLAQPVPVWYSTLRELPTERILREAKKKPLTEEDETVRLLLRRGLLKKDTRTYWSITLTELGRQIVFSEIPETPFIEKVTPEIISSKAWHGQPFRWYDVKAWVPKIWGGRKNPLKYLMERIREIFIAMGFREMRSPWVDMEFWCFDSMWIPQDHPAREMQSTFWLKQPKRGNLPDADLVNFVKKVQETGEGAESKGWRLPWSKDIASRCILRTHTTATTFRVLGFGIRNGIIKPPVKFFAIGRVFRNETIDWKHLAEFHQIEGFVVAPNLTLRSLMGYIKEFYMRMGIKKIRFKPTYNPYTEPSMEIFAWHEKNKKWVEVGNSGMFRPESLAPYGVKWPTIAWGLALERLAMLLWNIEDIRTLLGHTIDLQWVRTYRYPQKVFE